MQVKSEQAKQEYFVKKQLRYEQTLWQNKLNLTLYKYTSQSQLKRDLFT
jgi:hypothetical protein